jgi:acyl-coenzyme A synthetase/AMP-(fatty) acid ligase
LNNIAVSPIGDWFIKIAEEYSDFPSIINEVSNVTYERLAFGVEEFVHRFSDLGVDQGAIVALNSNDIQTTVSTLLATAIIGCQLVSTSEALARQGILKPTHFFKTFEAKGKAGIDFIEIDKDWFPSRGINNQRTMELPQVELNAPWLWLNTSGTTGRPKFFCLTQRMATDRTKAIEEDFPLASSTCVMLFNNISRPFFARALGALLHAGTIVDSDDPEIWNRHGVDCVFCSPSQFELWRKKHSLKHRFSRVEVSGAKLEDDLAVQLSKSFYSIVDVYGASETNKSFANLIAVDSEGQIVRSGKPLDSIVEINNDNGEPCSEGEKGTVRVRNGYLVEGYLKAEKSTRENFRDGWFYPGDIAYWGANGELVICGRTDEIISFGGVKIDANLIDVIIKSVPGVVDAVSIKSPKKGRLEICAFVMYDVSADPTQVNFKIRDAYQSHTGFPCFLGPIHQTNKIPYSSEGRPLRAAFELMLHERIVGHNDAE